jgi:hypothetical protein
MRSKPYQFRKELKKTRSKKFYNEISLNKDIIPLSRNDLNYFLKKEQGLLVKGGLDKNNTWQVKQNEILKFQKKS